MSEAQKEFYILITLANEEEFYAGPFTETPNLPGVLMHFFRKMMDCVAKNNESFMTDTVKVCRELPGDFEGDEIYEILWKNFPISQLTLTAKYSRECFDSFIPAGDFLDQLKERLEFMEENSPQCSGSFSDYLFLLRKIRQNPTMFWGCKLKDDEKFEIPKNYDDLYDYLENVKKRKAEESQRPTVKKMKKN